MIRVLLDENVPNKLRQALTEFDPATAQLMGFAGLRNGELLDAAEAAGFTVLLTGDKSMEYEQRIPGRKIAVVALSAPHWPIIKHHLEKIRAAVARAEPGKVTRVDVGAFARRRRKPEGPSLG